MMCPVWLLRAAPWPISHSPAENDGCQPYKLALPFGFSCEGKRGYGLGSKQPFEENTGIESVPSQCHSVVEKMKGEQSTKSRLVYGRHKNTGAAVPTDSLLCDSTNEPIRPNVAIVRN